jgi:IclR family pca regulon transcriptional regulator
MRDATRSNGGPTPSTPGSPPPADPGESVRAFDRGLAVMRSLSGAPRGLTLAAVARATGLNRATARRLLRTLVAAGYARQDEEQFRLTPRVLELGHAYLSSTPLTELAAPILEDLSRALNEATSVGVLDGRDVIYIARVPANRVMTVTIGVGTRFPAYRTSLGRVLLAELPADEIAAHWTARDPAGVTPHTVRSLTALREDLTRIRQQGFAILDQELELGVRSAAAPIRDRHGTTVAALNVSTHTDRTSQAELRERFVPPLLRAAATLTDALALRDL